MGSQEDELDWPGIKAAALQALDAAILIAGRSAKGVLVQQHPVPWPPDHNRLTLVPGPARGVYWRDCQYFAVARISPIVHRIGSRWSNRCSTRRPGH